MKLHSGHSLIVMIGLLIGTPVGLGTFTFYYANGFSYLSDNPKSCINCHVMNSQFESWKKSSHRAVAVCNDCHTPGGYLTKYAAKASNGFAHSWAFTTGQFKEPIEIKPHNRERVEVSCRNCHSALLESSHFSRQQLKQVTCTHCHSQVGHNK